MKMLHGIFRKALDKLLADTWNEVTGREVNHASLTPARHKLVFLYMFYTLLKQKGVENMAQAISHVKAKKSWIVKKMREGSCERITNRKWMALKPNLCYFPSFRVLSIMTRMLRECDVNPVDAMEERDFLLISLIMERYVPYHSPYTLLLLLDDADIVQVLEFIENVKEVKSQNVIKTEINRLSPRYRKALKLILLLYAKHNEFNVTYADSSPLDLKCLACVPAEHETECTYVICEYCREMLVYRDMRKRPTSFGFYLQTEHMEKRCYRDDSNRLRCMLCFKPNEYVSLLFSHPDRSGVGLCRGRRSCFMSVGFSDMMCSNCAVTLQPWQIHEKTCLGLKKKEPCKTCSIVYQSLDGNVPEQPPREEDTNINHNQTQLKSRRQPALLRVMEYAKNARERRKLIK